jgi:hypothetical protein
MPVGINLDNTKTRIVYLKAKAFKFSIYFIESLILAQDERWRRG